eukprot:GHVU01194293.1.p3 GENE.GHVU01194293.1~~GHVU01194293.1.p3  ORF type:complete len:101 (-),score=17.06 GHVU01194293.1:40-342(-)
MRAGVWAVLVFVGLCLLLDASSSTPLPPSLQAKIAKVDATKEKSTADKFQIRGAAIGGSSISGSSIDWWRIDCRAFDALVNRQINQEERSKRIVGSMSIR